MKLCLHTWAFLTYPQGTAFLWAGAQLWLLILWSVFYTSRPCGPMMESFVGKVSVSCQSHSVPDAVIGASFVLFLKPPARFCSIACWFLRNGDWWPRRRCPALHCYCHASTATGFPMAPLRKTDLYTWEGAREQGNPAWQSQLVPQLVPHTGMYMEA